MRKKCNHSFSSNIWPFLCFLFFVFFITTEVTWGEIISINACDSLVLCWLLYCVLSAGVDDERLRQLRKPGQVKGQSDFSTKTPHLILTLLPSDRVDNPAVKSRKKRAAATTDTTTCSR